MLIPTEEKVLTVVVLSQEKTLQKVDRSAAYATRHIAKNLVAAGVANEILVQVSYAIGVAEPTSINVNTYGTSNVNLTDGEIGKIVESIFDMRPYFIEQRLKLRNPIYSETAAYGHMGRKNEMVTKVFKSPDGQEKKLDVELFTWEKLDYVDHVKLLLNYKNKKSRLFIGIFYLTLDLKLNQYINLFYFSILFYEQ